MIKTGKVQLLTVAREAPFGIFLISDSGDKKDEVLLPGKEVPSGLKIGHQLEVFVYRDSKDRPIATTRRPKVQVGEMAMLRVVENTQIGSFLDWGLERDLFLPFKEQTTKVKVNHEYLIEVYTDKSDRLCATMDVYKYLDNQSPYKQDDNVKGIVISVKDDFGAFVAVDEKYHGLIPNQELFRNLQIGEAIEGRVTKVREDGKLNISLREKAYVQMDKDSEKIYNHIVQQGGMIHLNDKSDPEKIKSELGMSKNAFKRAVGRLLKQGKIKFIDNGIQKV